jgi:hypothetical protein
MKFSVYTSCALNYLPKARALAESLRLHQPDARLTLCLADRAPDWFDPLTEPFDRIWTPEQLGYSPDWIFQHALMELCTAIKGRALARLIQEDDAELTVFLDPDVMLFHSLDPVLEMMQGGSIGLLPHILEPETTTTAVELTELSVAAHGTYNLGHLFVRPDDEGRRFANWWADRLDRYCFDDRRRGFFTDQRWIDLAPALFSGARILRAPTLNVASWNLTKRRIRQTQSGAIRAFTVNDEPLITYHFSGTGPAGTHRKVRETLDPQNPGTAEIERIYELSIGRHGQASLAAAPCRYDFFDDGTRISATARRLYRDHADLRRAFPDPYSVSGEIGGFLGWLRQNRPGQVEGLQISPGRLDRAFRELFDETYYLSRYPDAAEAVANGSFASAIDHYCQLGSRLLLDPNEYFLSGYYLDRAFEAGLAPKPVGQGIENTLLWHYLSEGLQNGLEPIEFFDSRWYLEAHEDLRAAMRTGQILTPLGHFLNYGSAEGRDPGPAFSGQRYLEATPSANEMAAQSGLGAFGAFVRMGGVTGRVHVPG